MEHGIKVENTEQLLQLLSQYAAVVQTKAVNAAMEKAAEYVNAQALIKLHASKKGTSRTGYKYYSSAFRHEPLRTDEPDTAGIRFGVSSRKEGYKLRWLEWGTDERHTYKRTNALTKKISEPAYRGFVEGNHFFFGTVRTSEDPVFRILSETVIKELERLTDAANKSTT